MKSIHPGSRARGFTLLELLCVIAIIGILAAMLLPAINQAKARAKRAACVSNLREVGLAFHVFASDHRGRLPMQVPANDGGSEEFVRTAGRASNDFHFAFRHFQPLASELATPRILICPADSRLPAGNFVALRNDNVSYFVNVSAEHGKSASILAGDRNLTNDWVGNRGLVPLDPNNYLRWTHELHRFKGNLLFADGHVEELNRPALMVTSLDPEAVARLSLPTVSEAASLPSEPVTGEVTRSATLQIAAQDESLARATSSPQVAAFDAAWLDTNAPADTGLLYQVTMVSIPSQAGFRRFTGAGAERHSPLDTAKPKVVATNRTNQVVLARTGEDVVMATFDLQLVGFLQNFVKWTYLLLLLLLLLYLAFRLWQWERRRMGRQRGGRTNW